MRRLNCQVISPSLLQERSLYEYYQSKRQIFLVLLFVVGQLRGESRLEVLARLQIFARYGRHRSFG